MSTNNTKTVLETWERKVEKSRNDGRPMAPEYSIHRCSTENCDSYQLYDVFSPVEALNCKYVTVTDGRTAKGGVVFVCDKHDTK